MNITQGKLVIGLDVLSKQENLQCVALVYNAILGDGANSMLFQNVREKASLAYTARSNYVRQKNNVFIRCGIEIENYQKALYLIKVQIEDIVKPIVKTRHKKYNRNVLLIESIFNRS